MMPKFFGAWLDKSLLTCIFSTAELRNFKLPKLQSSPWYLECAKNYAPSEEEEEKMKAFTAAGRLIDVVDIEEDEEAVDIAHILPTTSRKGRTKATKSRSLRGRNRKKPTANTGIDVIGQAASTPVDPCPLDISQSDRSFGMLSVTSVKADLPIPTQLLTQTAFRPITNGICSQVLILHDSISRMMDEKLKTSILPPALLDISKFSRRVVPRRVRSLAEVNDSNAFIDFLLADVLDNLSIPHISNPLHVVPPWNNASADAFVEPLFAFAQDHVGDAMGVFLFVPESPTIHKDILTWAAANGYTVHKDWWGINELRLTSFRDPKRTTRRFWILLFVRESYKNNPVKSSFQLRNNSETRDASIDLEEDDLLHNFTTSTSQLMNGSIPWLGAREKDPRLVQILVEASTSPGDIVLDYNASTGASVHACRSTGHHLIAMESDPAIFKDVLEALKDLIDVLRTATKKRAASNSLIDDNIPASSVKRPRFYKGLVRIGVTEMLDEIRSPDGSFHLPCYIEPLTTTFAEILSQVIAPSKSRASRGFICSSQILGFGCP